MTQPASVSPEQNWETYYYNTNEGPVFATFYTDADKIEQREFPFCGRVIIPIKSPNANGGPEQQEAQALWDMEDSLVEILTEEHVECILLARLTHNGERELVFQLADWESFRPRIGKWILQHRDYDIDVSEHDGWDFFEQCVWPDDDGWTFIHDRRVVDALVENGSDPEQEHALEYVFRGDAKALADVSQRLVERGFEFGGEDKVENRTQLIMIKRTLLDLDVIFQESLRNKQLAAELEVEYDGWGAGIVK